MSYRKKKNRLIFISGGVRSGKSRFAINLAKNLSEQKKVLYIATTRPQDAEMRERIKRHRLSRPKEWCTLIVEKDLGKVLLKRPENVFLIDCLTLYISNLVLEGKNEETILDEIRDIVSTLKKLGKSAIIVSNEVGMGIVPRNRLSRTFRDISGRANQYLAQETDEVYFTVSGISLRMK